MAKDPTKFTILPLGPSDHLVPIGKVISLTPHVRRSIICVPTPCRGGWHYCPDWYGLTEFQ